VGWRLSVKKTPSYMIGAVDHNTIVVGIFLYTGDVGPCNHYIELIFRNSFFPP
jgi:hypothetical protein